MYIVILDSFSVLAFKPECPTALKDLPFPFSTTINLDLYTQHLVHATTAWLNGRQNNWPGALSAVIRPTSHRLTPSHFPQVFLGLSPGLRSSHIHASDRLSDQLKLGADPEGAEHLISDCYRHWCCWDATLKTHLDRLALRIRCFFFISKWHINYSVSLLSEITPRLH